MSQSELSEGRNGRGVGQWWAEATAGAMEAIPVVVAEREMAEAMVGAEVRAVEI